MGIKATAVLVCFAFVVANPALARSGGGHSFSSHSSYSTSTRSSPGEHMVSGYTKANGTYVAPHYQTNPNSTRNDNYSTRGNINPHTGELGTKPRDEDLTQPH